jgi:hypothetical protein
LSRDHSKNLFDFSKTPALVIINDCHKPQSSSLKNVYWQDLSQSNTAMKAIANLISEISNDMSQESEIILGSLGKGSLLLPGVAAGLRASDLSVVGYMLIDSYLPGAIEPDSENSEFFETLPLMSDWPDAPIYYLWSKDEFSEKAKEAALRGWFVINAVDETTINEVVSAISF